MKTDSFFLKYTYSVLDGYYNDVKFSAWDQGADKIVYHAWFWRYSVRTELIILL